MDSNSGKIILSKYQTPKRHHRIRFWKNNEQPRKHSRTHPEPGRTWQYRKSNHQIEDDLAAGQELTPFKYDWSDFPDLFARINQVPILERITDPELLQAIRSNLPDQMDPGMTMQDLSSLWCEIFDRIFFFGSLGRYIDVKPATDPIMHREYAYEKQTLYLDINSGNPRDLVLDLLHGMLHAFFAIFTETTYRTVAARDGGLGRGSHGPPFCNVLTTLENALRKAVTFPVPNSAFDHAKQSMLLGWWRPSVATMRNWGATEEQVETWSPGGLLGDPRSVASERVRQCTLENERCTVE